MSYMKYCEYFDINETYFPCIDESAINAGVDWQSTYPHETFIKLLKATEAMLGGATKRSIWIHGAYGTGKSQCAYTLKKILEVPAEELKEYWDRYEPLKREVPLLNKLLGHKEKKVVTAFRYASGSIDTPQQLFLAVQESVKQALMNSDVEYKGENTLKESVIEWIQDPSHKVFVDSLLNKPEWQSLFAQSTADEIINSLRKSSDVSSLMDNIFKMASKEGITALSLSADRLRDWIHDVISRNGIKIVLVWDEFSDFFRLNKNSLGEFQKVVSMCEEMPFYLIVVTHPISSIITTDDSWKIVQQRFDRIEIELPENIAFDLIGHAFAVKNAARDNWNAMTGGLESSVPSSKQAVAKAANISDSAVMRRILPIHPMAALVLKNIAHAFQSNQRSMFDFIKTSHDTDVKAFQWFIKNYGPMDEEPLLTIDMLWDFFYVKGKEYLSHDIKLILDTFPQQTMLTEKEKKVLKAVLIMQAIDQRLSGALPILKPTDQNLSYAFEGIAEYENSAKNIAKGLENKDVLISTPIGDGKKAYGAAVLADASAKIETSKANIRKASTTYQLVSNGDMLATALSLTPALKLRFALDPDSGSLPVVTISDFTKTMDSLKNKEASWHFFAVLALAKDEDEALNFRNLIRRTVANEAYKNIIVIDALSSPLGKEAFEQYVDFSAMSEYYQGNNNQLAKDNGRKAKDVLNRTWKDKIHDGQFYVYTYANQEGEKANGASGVHVILQTIALTKYRYVYDFTKNLTETQLKLTQGKQVARHGMGGTDIKGLIAGCERSVLGAVWGKEKYWTLPELQEIPIVVVKKALDALIEKEFNANGQISINEIYDCLTDDFGYSPCNLTAFITGFLLKEYSSDPYRCVNAEGYPEAMTPDKLSEMINNIIKNRDTKPTYIVKMTQEEKTFYEATETAWGVSTAAYSSPAQVATAIGNKIRELGYPVWCLSEVDTAGVYDVIKKYIELVQSDGKATHNIAIEIGKIAMQKPSISRNLREILTPDKCKDGMMEFLKHFDDGKLIELAKEIGAEELLPSDIKKIFSVKHSALWLNETGEDEIRKLSVEYGVIKQTNLLLNVSCNSKEKAFGAWREELKFIGFSCDALRARKPALSKVLSYLLKIVNREDILPDMMETLLAEMVALHSEIKDMLENRQAVFNELYDVYLEGLSDEEKDEVRKLITQELFITSANASNYIVKNSADAYRKNQIKTQLFNRWRELTQTKTPKEWSQKFDTPILCLLEADKYGDGKKAFAILNSTSQSDSEIRFAMDFLNNENEFFVKIKDESYREEKFVTAIIGEYSALLPDTQKVRQALEALTVDVYDWYDSPIVKQKIRSMANAEYNAGGSDKALTVIDGMSDAELKRRLKELVQKDLELGVKIIKNGGK